MASGFKNSSSVDLDNIFSIRAGTDPSTNVTGYVTSDGLDLASRYYPFQAGMTPVTATGFKTLVSGESTDLCNVFAPPPVWNTVGTGIVTGTRVESICVVDSSNIYVAGIFTNAGGTPVTNVAKWNGSAWSSLGFSSAAFRPNAGSITVRAIVGSNVFLSYQIRNTGTGNDEPYISMYNFSTWTTLTGVYAAMGGTGSRTISDLCLLDTNTLFVSGLSFSTTLGLAKYNISGTTWTQIGDGLIKAGFIQTINAIAKISSTQIIVGGSINVSGGANFEGISVYNNTTGQWAQFIASFPMVTIYSISVVSPTVVFVGGTTGVTRINDAGTGWQNTNVTSGWSSNIVNHVYAVDSSNVYFAGNFITTPYIRVAKWNGTSAVALGRGIPNGIVYSVAGTGTRNVYFGGTFTAASNVSVDVSMSLITRWA